MQQQAAMPPRHLGTWQVRGTLLSGSSARWASAIHRSERNISLTRAGRPYLQGCTSRAHQPEAHCKVERFLDEKLKILSMRYPLILIKDSSTVGVRVPASEFTTPNEPLVGSLWGSHSLLGGACHALR
jgi:hypothetical protein